MLAESPVHARWIQGRSAPGANRRRFVSSSCWNTSGASFAKRLGENLRLLASMLQAVLSETNG